MKTQAMSGCHRTQFRTFLPCISELGIVACARIVPDVSIVQYDNAGPELSTKPFSDGIMQAGRELANNNQHGRD